MKTQIRQGTGGCKYNNSARTDNAQTLIGKLQISSNKLILVRHSHSCQPHSLCIRSKKAETQPFLRTSLREYEDPGCMRVVDLRFDFSLLIFVSSGVKFHCTAETGYLYSVLRKSACYAVFVSCQELDYMLVRMERHRDFQVGYAGSEHRVLRTARRVSIPVAYITHQWSLYKNEPTYPVTRFGISPRVFSFIRGYAGRRG